MGVVRTNNRKRQRVAAPRHSRVPQRRLDLESLVRVVVCVVGSFCFSLVVTLALRHKCFLSFLVMPYCSQLVFLIRFSLVLGSVRFPLYLIVIFVGITVVTVHDKLTSEASFKLVFMFPVRTDSVSSTVAVVIEKGPLAVGALGPVHLVRRTSYSFSKRFVFFLLLLFFKLFFFDCRQRFLHYPLFSLDFAGN